MESGPIESLRSYVKMSEIQMAVLAVTTFTLTFKIYQKLTQNEKPPPPGPWGFPIIGHLPLLGRRPHVTFMKLREEFGDIFQIRMGSWPTVVVNGKRLIREALRDSGDDFSGRPGFLSSQMNNDGVNLAFGKHDEKWQIHRKLAKRVLFDFSDAKKNPIEEMVHLEVDLLLDTFLGYKGTAFDPKEHIQVSVSSVFYQICFGREQDIRGNRHFEQYLRNANAFSVFVSAGNPVDVMPWLRYFMPSKLTLFKKFLNVSKGLIDRKIDEHKSTFSPDDIRDLTDGLLEASMKQTDLPEKRVLETVDALFGAAFDTTSVTLTWAMLLMAANPDVQKRVQAEIDDVVGTGRRPCLKDRDQMPYTEAVLHEIMRFPSLIPLSLPHSTTRDTELAGFSIKKDTVVFINLYSMSHNKDVWGDPDVFRPERFLDESGQINNSLLDEFLPFSTGHRKCLGERLARMEIFLFFTGLLQRCSILKPPEVDEYNLAGELLLTNQSFPFTIRVEARI